MRSQHWFRWLGAIRQQAIPWAIFFFQIYVTIWCHALDHSSIPTINRTFHEMVESVIICKPLSITGYLSQFKSICQLYSAFSELPFRIHLSVADKAVKTLNKFFNHDVDNFEQHKDWCPRADSRFAPSQWETSLQSNAVSHWLGANLESALMSWKNMGSQCSESIGHIVVLLNNGNILDFNSLWPSYATWSHGSLSTLVMLQHKVNTKANAEFGVPNSENIHVFQWNFVQSSNIFIQGNAYKNVACYMPAIFFQTQCVKYPRLGADFNKNPRFPWYQGLAQCNWAKSNDKGYMYLVPSHNAIQPLVHRSLAWAITVC